MKLFSALILFLPLLFSGCPRGGGPESAFVLGTLCTVDLYGQGSRDLYRAVFERLGELEDILSANREGTDLDRVNRGAGKERVPVRPELIDLLKQALYYAELSGGAFDPSVGPLVKLWGIGTDAPRVPSGGEIGQALALVDYRDIEIDEAGGTVFLKRRGMALDLGAAAKGYAADEAVKLLARRGIRRGIIDLGGNIFAYGERERGRPWRIGVQDPGEHRGAYIGVLELNNKSVVTSGVYERYFEEDGRRYHHILSTETGGPAETGLLSVTVAAGSSTAADALSTAAFALGWERGRRLIETVPGAGGIFIFEDLSVRLTPGIRDTFSLTGPDYRLAE
ncbi:MAG: FAD:protein FMN transferase [Treponema sp.]|nr:FAD:protein FMN transferase [Treponema sp.]